MKRFAVATAGLLLAINAQAALVTIDFEDVAEGTVAPLTSRGFVFSGGWPGNLLGTSPRIENNGVPWLGNNGITLCYDTPSCFAQLGGNPTEDTGPVGYDPYLNFSKQDSTLFDLVSFKVNITGGCLCDPPGTITGYFADGSSIQEEFRFPEGYLPYLITPGPEWKNLQSVRITGGPRNLAHDIMEMRFDDITVSTVTVPVPVPAAVWLFCSGLGVLGWLRRRHAVNA